MVKKFISHFFLSYLMTNLQILIKIVLYNRFKLAIICHGD